MEGGRDHAGGERVVQNVLVLGAGASKTYKFPLARRLVQTACEFNWTGEYQQLERCGLDAASCVAFVTRLRRSGTTSIDQYLEYEVDGDVVLLGKKIIAFLLAQHESVSALTHPGREGHWYELLTNCLIGRTLDTFPERDIAIVTFNYERSLDYYLWDCL
jgi:hypothetical protein